MVRIKKSDSQSNDMVGWIEVFFVLAIPINKQMPNQSAKRDSATIRKEVEEERQVTGYFDEENWFPRVWFPF